MCQFNTNINGIIYKFYTKNHKIYKIFYLNMLTKSFTRIKRTKEGKVVKLNKKYSAERLGIVHT